MSFASVLYSIKQSIDEPDVLSMNSKSVPSLGPMGFASVLYSIKQSINEADVLSMNSKSVPSLGQMSFAYRQAYQFNFHHFFLMWKLEGGIKIWSQLRDNQSLWIVSKKKVQKVFRLPKKLLVKWGSGISRQRNVTVSGTRIVACYGCRGPHYQPRLRTGPQWRLDHWDQGALAPLWIWTSRKKGNTPPLTKFLGPSWVEEGTLDFFRLYPPLWRTSRRHCWTPTIGIVHDSRTSQIWTVRSAFSVCLSHVN